MSSSMRITGIRLKNYRQFRNFNLDLTDPVTKEPLDKVCFIGTTGTGKTTLLELLADFLETGGKAEDAENTRHFNRLIAYKVYQDKDEFFILCDRIHNAQKWHHSPPYVFPASVSERDEWKQLWDVEIDHANDEKLKTFLEEHDLSQRNSNIIEHFKLKNNGQDLAIYAPQSGQAHIDDVPKTNLSNALALFDEFGAYHEVSFDTIENFWNVLTYQIKNRESNYLQFLDSSETQSLSVAEANSQFNKKNRRVLDELAKQWEPTLGPSGLAFDVENAKIPVQLTENLQVYIKLKSSGIHIPYNLLSNGIRSFIFRLGHIFTLYFNRQIERGFLLLDEPEASLFPDLLHDIVAQYESIVHNTQFFVATHSPIVAAQFRPEERFILEFDETGAVNWRRGVSPEGDDPNDLLKNDFAIRSLYRDKGQKEYERYLQIRQQILSTDDKDEKLALLDEYAEIGHAYNFPAHEIPEKV